MAFMEQRFARRPSAVDPCASPTSTTFGVAPCALSSTADSLARCSFSSVRETDGGLVQTFTRSKFSSYVEAQEEAIVDDTPMTDASLPASCYLPPLTQPHSKLHRFLCPAEAFRGWKEIPLSGRRASRSCDNLQRLRMTWDLAPDPVKPSAADLSSVPSVAPLASVDSAVVDARRSALERLPSEILSTIIGHLVVEIPPNGLTKRNADLMSLLLTSRVIHAMTLATLYRHITIPHSRIFRKFLTTIITYPALATIIRRLDFSHFNPSMHFTSAAERAMAKNLTSETLLQCLQLTPYVQDFLAQEYVDGDLSADVLAQLFFHSPLVKALDFCGCSSSPFKKSWESLLERQWPDRLTVTRLSFHRCISLPATVFEKILPRLPRVTHLDLMATRVNNNALLSIPRTARLTHLNLGKCKGITADAVIDFIANHPAAKTLVYLNLATDPSSHMMFDKPDISRLLPLLPPTLRFLSLKGSRMDPVHILELQRLSKTVEDLAVGRDLAMRDIVSIFFKDNKEPLEHNLRSLDITDVSARDVHSSELLAAATRPLRVLEIDEQTWKRTSNVKNFGWATNECKRRYWLVRNRSGETAPECDRRWWKHGAESWGMHKIPVVNAEVGGLYGNYMFGTKI